jgi:nitrogen fixation NifU-like protein
MSFVDSRDLYQDVILDRGRNPRHMHRLDPFDASAHGDNPMCGDKIEVRVKFAANGDVAEAAFEARGCAISLASADLMAEAVRGRNTAQIRELASSFASLVKTGESSEDDAAIEKLKPLSGVSEYPSRIKCATLPWSALIAALDHGQEVCTHD